jgi:hypothetical protein
MKLGIIQGRLLNPIDGNIQEFPKKNWEDEFDIIKKLGLSHIEWIITNKSLSEGVLNLDVSKYSDNISSVTCDNLVNKNIVSHTFLSKQLRPICEWAIKNNIKVISIPLLEDSQISTTNQTHNIYNFKKALIPYSLIYPELEFHFEMESSWNITTELVKDCSNFFLIYDTGNITSCGFDHKEWITNNLQFIKNVHLKDRTVNPLKTVEPLTGDTDFTLIFKTLNELKYKEIFTLQLARGKEGDEIKTIKEYIKLFKHLYEK